MTNDFEDWLLRGPGEAMFGAILKNSAGIEKARITKRLSTPNLFPHIEHEDRMAVERLNHAQKEGDRMLKRGRARNQAIASLLDSDAGLRITEEDLNAEGG